MDDLASNNLQAAFHLIREMYLFRNLNGYKEVCLSHDSFVGTFHRGGGRFGRGRGMFSNNSERESASHVGSTSTVLGSNPSLGGIQYNYCKEYDHMKYTYPNKQGATTHVASVVDPTQPDDRKTKEMKLAETNDTDSSLASSSHGREESKNEPDIQKVSAKDRSCLTHADKTGTEASGSDCADKQKVSRPMSPGTLALMCDEQDTIFTSSRNPSVSPMLPDTQRIPEVYVEQERAILTAFRDSLLKLINCGRMKEAKFSSIMAMNSESTNLQEPVTNEIVRPPVLSTANISQTVNEIPASSNSHLPPKSGQQRKENGQINPKSENTWM